MSYTNETESIRLSATEQEAERQQQRNRAARGNVAAMICDRHGVVPGADNATLAVQLAAREFADLADALGLDGPVRDPGRCPCGRQLSASQTTRRKNQRNSGLCRTCDLAAEAVR